MDVRVAPVAGQSVAVEPVTFAVVDAGSCEARWAMWQYFEELARRFPGGFVPGDALHEAAVRYNPPTGAFVIASIADETIGCGALDFLDDTTAEIKRMWISSQSRGIGLGKRLLAHLEAEARRAGRSRVVLDTNGSLTEAIAMYEASGYVPTARYNDNPYAEHWFTKELTDAEQP
jgi:ribosomal protein S18 acetylase RimI-like enzyme